MKVAFYLRNSTFPDVDLSHIERGNPGIGGTEYMFLIIPYTINLIYGNRCRIILGANCIEHLPAELEAIKCESIKDLVLKGDGEIDYIIYHQDENTRKEAKAAIGNKKTRLISWTHNFIPRITLTQLANDNMISAIVCVSKEQLNMYRDHKAFLKSLYIYNGVPATYIKKTYGDLLPYKDRPNEVTYIGNIVDFKGVHILAKAWKKVLAVVPDAKLNIIGGGNLYSRNTKLGKYGIAEESYENEFMPYLTDEDGNVLPSVKFWGVLGVEKNDILARTRVGVPNPSGVSETFCITALEMQAMGALVTTIDFGGFRNTVYKTGLLYKDPKDLAECIIKQLQQTDNDIDGFYSWMEENFAFEKVVEDWMRLFESLKEKRQIKPLEYNNPNADSLMQMREYNRKIKSVLGYWLPTIDFYRSILRRIGLVKGF